MIMVHLQMSTLLALAVSIPAFVVAGPFNFPTSMDALPREASHVAFDESRRMLLAFNERGELLGMYDSESVSARNAEKRDGSTCTPLSVEDAQRRMYCHLNCGTRPADD